MLPLVETHSYPSYSQAGEDRLLYYFFQALGSVQALTYLDVGAASPVGHNNTYLFYTLGGSGVLVEANDEYGEAYSSIRPRDTVEAVAVVPSRMRNQELVSFHLLNSPGWNTVSTEHAEVASRLGKGSLRRTLSVPCRTLNEIMAWHFTDKRLDILSLDIEGIDAEVLSEIDFSRFRPRAIVAEDPFGHAGQPTMTGPTADILRNAGYRPFGWTFVNFVLVDERLMSGMRF
ncbi:MAG: FkbM family methyltransferase [Bryobacteraceae bacterium]|nr:FkbM family methyltransferase [Bryobacteraceae bacterium]